MTTIDCRTRSVGDAITLGPEWLHVQPLDVRADLDLPRIPLPTRTGDVTVHCSCTLHMSRPPVERGRRVVYTGFDLVPREGDVVQTVDAAEKRRARAALNDQVRRREREARVDRENRSCSHSRRDAERE